MIENNSQLYAGIRCKRSAEEANYMTLVAVRVRRKLWIISY